MPLWPVLVSSVLLVLFLTCVHLILNRGKAHARGLFILLAVGVPFTVPVFATMYFELEIGLGLYSVAVLLAFTPFLLIMGKNIVKRRQPLFWPTVLILGILLVEFSPFVTTRLIPFSVALGITLVTIFLIRQFRYPFLNPMWLHAVVRLVAAEVEEHGRYSSKPIVVDSSFEGRHTTGAIDGLSLIIKKDKVIVRISKKLHAALGRPNLKDFANRIVQRISEA